MFHMCLRRFFRNELGTKNAGGPEMLKTNRGPEFEASYLLRIGRYLTGIQTCIPKRMENRILQKNSESFKQFIFLAAFYEGR